MALRMDRLERASSIDSECSLSMDGSVGSWGSSYSPRGSGGGEWAQRPPTPRERVQQQVVLNQAKRLRRLQQVQFQTRSFLEAFFCTAVQCISTFITSTEAVKIILPFEGGHSCRVGVHSGNAGQQRHSTVIEAIKSRPPCARRARRRWQTRWCCRWTRRACPRRRAPRPAWA